MKKAKQHAIVLSTFFAVFLCMLFSLNTSNAYAAIEDLSSCPNQSIERTYYSTFSSFSGVSSSDESVVIPQLTGSGMIFSDKLYYSGTVTFYFVGTGTAEVTLYAGGFNAGTIDIVVNNHEWSDEYSVDYYPSCIETGMESMHCIKCGAVKEGSERVIPTTEHSFDSWVINDQDCINDGSKYLVCSLCGAKKEDSEEIIPAFGHELIDYGIVQEPTCTECGYREMYCSRCDSYMTEPIPAKGHKWNSDYTVDKAATCTEDGSESIHCSACDTTKDERIIPAKGHQWKKSYTIDKKATYAAKGSKSIHCSECNAVKPNSAVAIPKLTVKPTKLSKVTATSKGFTVKWNKGSGITGYQVQYALNSKFTSGKKAVYVTKASTVSKKFAKLKAKKKYYVKVRTYKTYKGKKYYSKWSKAKVVTTKN